MFGVNVGALNLSLHLHRSFQKLDFSINTNTTNKRSVSNRSKLFERIYFVPRFLMPFTVKIHLSVGVSIGFINIRNSIVFRSLRSLNMSLYQVKP